MPFGVTGKMSTTALEAGIHMLQEDHDNGARFLATKAVGVLNDILTDEVKVAGNGEEVWNALRDAAWRLRSSRPSMNAAIGSALVQGLVRVKESWRIEFGSDGWMKVSEDAELAKLSDVGKQSLHSTIEDRNDSAKYLAANFTSWLAKKSFKIKHPLRILTLSFSSSLKNCLTTAFREIPGLMIDLKILESRPRCEGAALGIALSNEIHGLEDSNGRLSIQIATDSSVAMMSKDVDVVLLGADCISSWGDVSNKMGSFAAVTCAKAISPTCEVVVVAESDKITKPGGVDQDAVEENDMREVFQTWNMDFLTEAFFPEQIKIRNVYFEWVPSKCIDIYICETGELSTEGVLKAAVETEVKERDTFMHFERRQ